MFLLVVFGLLTLDRIQSNAVTSPQIRILDVATKASETRLIPHSVEYRSPLHPYVRPQNRLNQNAGALKSYIIYDDYPLIIFKEWKANPATDFPPPSQNYLDLSRQQEQEFPQDFYGQHPLPPPKPTLAYRSVYSNIIKVFDGSLGNFDRNRFEGEKYAQVFRGGFRKSPPPIDYELIRPQEISEPQPYHNSKLPENFPNVFSPNSKFDFFSFNERVPQSPHYFYPREGFFSTHTVNYNNKEEEGNPDEVEILPEEGLYQKNKMKPFLCSFIRVNQRQFPKHGAPCGRSEDDLPITLPDFPDYSNLPNHKIPVEHRRQHFHMKRIKRSERNESYGSRGKREVGFGYGYSGWASPFSYENGYDGYYPSREGYRSFGNGYDSNYFSNRDRNRNYRNSYYTGGRYDEYDDYQNSDDSSSRGLTGYLTNGGRRYDSRRNNNNDEDEDNDDENDNNRENDSDEDMERINSNRRDTNGRRNNDDSRDRRRNNNSNNNNNDEEDYRDNRRNNNRNNNSRRYNNSNNRRNNNDRYNYNSGRNRYYSNNNGYGSYGSTYGGYGSGGYGSTYRNNGGYGYGGYGNSFGSF